MEGKFNLAQGCGHWRVQEQGEELWIYIEQGDDRRGLYKGYIEGGGGRYMLGTLMPEGDKLVLKRRLLRKDLTNRGVWPIQSCGVVLAYATPPVACSPKSQSLSLEWRREPCPENLLGDRLLSCCAQGHRGTLVRRRGEGFQMAFPFRPQGEFPLQPLFCLARVQKIEGRWYALYSFNQKGCPTAQ